MFKRVWLWTVLAVLCAPLAAWAQTGAPTTTLQGRDFGLGAKALDNVVYDANGFGPGLATHYYRDPSQWAGNWADNVAAPTVPAKDWTFTNYKYTRIEPLVSHLFVNRGWFSVRWNGYLTVPGDGAQQATYKFYVFADDGCRLFVDGVKLIDDFRPCSEKSPDAVRTCTVKLAPGRHKILVEYFEGQALAARDNDPISISWECAERSIKKQVIPATQFSHKKEDLTPLPGRLDNVNTSIPPKTN